MKLVLVLVLFTSLLGIVTAVIYELNDEEYYQMPPIVALDPYDRCLRQPGAAYCSAFFVYVADEHRPLLQQMQEFSEQNRAHYNHTRVFLGTCITSSCKHLLNTSSDLGSILEACHNETIHEKYKLKVRLDDEISCISNDGIYDNNKIVIDTVDFAVGIIVLAFVVFNIVGSYIDVNWSEESKNGVVPQILLCFSLSRNWKHLASLDENQDPRLERLKGFHGIRAISTTLVILAHSLLPCALFGKNPQFLEETYSNPFVHILLNGTLIMQTFLVMSAFLLIYSLQILAEKITITWKLLVMVLFKRLLRLTPPYALILALTATWLRHIGNGPLWQKALVMESNECRKHWWMNLLYITNYIDGHHCMPQSWYLAADTQLYIVGLVVYLLGRNLVVRKKLLVGLFLLGLVLPALHTYFQDLEGNLLITPIAVMDLFVTDPTFNSVYRHGHTNLSGYVIGLILGYLAYHLQKNNFVASNYKKWRPIYWSLIPLGCVIIMSNKVFYDGPRLGVGYRMLAAVVHKPLFATCVAAIILGFFVQFENVYRGVMEWGGWKPLSRVSYSAYLIHLAVIRTSSALNTDTFHVSYLRMAEVTNFSIMSTWFGAILFWLTVEAPLAHVTRILLEPRMPDAKKDL